jgi:hypothetical protein
MKHFSFPALEDLEWNRETTMKKKEHSTQSMRHGSTE